MQFSTQKQMTPRAMAMLGVLAVIWGGSFLSNRAALAEIGVLTVVGFRVAGGAVLLWAAVAIMGLPRPRGIARIWQFMIMGLLACALPFSLIVWGQKHIDSGLASILNASTAIFGVLMAAVFLGDERLTKRKAIGVSIGFCGVVLCVGPDALTGFDPASLGQLAVLAAALSYSLANVYTRMFIRDLAPEVSAAGMLTGASLWILPAALYVEGVPTLSYSLPVWGAIFWLAAIAAAVAFLIYYKVMAEVGAGNFSLVTLMIPPIAIALGALIYAEKLALTAYAGFIVLALGLLVLNGKLRLPNFK
jgi:drug/metabolite transporter (DMT)-like permease